MSKASEKKQQLAVREPSTNAPPVTFGESWGAKQIEPKFGDLLKVLPNEQAAQAFARIVITALNKTPRIKDCTNESILSCIFDLAAINLLPNSPHGHAYLIPYRIDGVTQCTVQIGYRGFAELAYRSSEVKMVQADVVRDGDEFKYKKGANIQQFVEHVKDVSKGRINREVLAAWASVELLNGGVAIEIMDTDELGRIERLANAKKDSPAWKQFGDEMRKKTAVKRLLKLLQISNMETVRAAIDIDNKASSLNLLPGVETAAKSDHNVLIKDAADEGETILEEQEPVAVEEGHCGGDWDEVAGEFIF